jgi:carbon monoxide dehydrogenase subunit G
VWRALFDVDGMRRILPGCRKLVEVEPDVFEAELDVSVAGIGCTYSARIALTEKVEPHSLRISGEGSGVLGHGRGEAQVRLTERDGNATALSYRYRATLGGRVASFGHRMLDGVVRLLVKQFFAGLSTALAPAGAAPRRSFGARLWDLFRSLFGLARR